MFSWFLHVVCSFLSRIVVEDSQFICCLYCYLLFYFRGYSLVVRRWILKKSMCFVDSIYYIVGRFIHCIAS